jgi:5-oxoprolinase (ATP-hydrolysing) subunit A
MRNFKIDLNCDIGESFGAYTIGNDAEILKHVSSANIACGFHGGDPSVMRKTVYLCIKNNIAIGAHPGLQDLIGFGRRNMNISTQEVYDLVLYQIGALYAFVKASGTDLHHVKPHGALYNMAAANQKLAESIAGAVYDFSPKLILYGLSGSKLIEAGKNKGLATASEVFADRSYQNDGTLTPRDQPNSLIHEAEASLRQVLGLVKSGRVLSVEGKEVGLHADTICIHGDGPNAVKFASEIRKKFKEEGILISKIEA